MAARIRRWMSVAAVIAVVSGVCLALHLLALHLWDLHRQEGIAEEAYRSSIRGLERRIRESGAKMDPDMLRGLQKALDMLRKREVPAWPVPVFGQIYQNGSSQQWFLAIGYLDTDADIQGIRIYESNADSGGNLTEDYPVFASLSDGLRGSGFFAHPFQGVGSLPVRIRIRDGDVKDEELWAEWLRLPRSDTLPPVWISLPSDSREVRLSLHDQSGQESEPIPVYVLGRKSVGGPHGGGRAAFAPQGASAL